MTAAGVLPVGSKWHEDGPGLPVEFARESGDGRLTLVLVEGAPVSTTLWCELNVSDLDQAVSALQAREGATTGRPIGRWPLPVGRNYPFATEIEQWAQTKGLAGVVWTALKPGWKDQRGEAPSLQDMLDYLRGLDDVTRRKAAEYIRGAPPQIQTAFRAALEAELERLP